MLVIVCEVFCGMWLSWADKMETSWFLSPFLAEEKKEEEKKEESEESDDDMGFGLFD